MAHISESNAATTVLGISELLENILLHVDPFQLYVLQAVNSTFRSAISETKSIRKRMHLEQSKPFEESRPLRHFLRDKRITAITRPFTITWHPACYIDLDLELSCEWTQQEEKKYWWNRFRAKNMQCMHPGSWRGIRVGQPEVFPVDEILCKKEVYMCGTMTPVDGNTLGAVMGEAVSLLWRKPSKCVYTFCKWTGSSPDSGRDWRSSSQGSGWCAIM